MNHISWVTSYSNDVSLNTWVANNNNAAHHNPWAVVVTILLVTTLRLWETNMLPLTTLGLLAMTMLLVTAIILLAMVMPLAACGGNDVSQTSWTTNNAYAISQRPLVFHDGCANSYQGIQAVWLFKTKCQKDGRGSPHTKGRKCTIIMTDAVVETEVQTQIFCATHKARSYHWSTYNAN